MPLVCTLLIARPLLDRDPVQLLAWAEERYRAGQAATAAAVYDALATATLERPAAFYRNQGHAHLRAGHVARAIQAYRRAQDRLLLHDEEVEFGLEAARGLVTDPIFAAPPADGWWDRVRKQVWRHGVAGVLAPWYLLWLLVGVLACAPPLTAGIRRRPLLLLAAATGVLLSVVLAAQAPEGDRGAWVVVAQDGVVLRQGNGESYPPWEQRGVPITLRAGVEGRLKGQRPNGWVWVALPDGQTGWLPRQAVLLAEPP
jgi:hypothetical protein